MASFREKGSVEKRNREFRIVFEELQLHFRELPHRRGLSERLQIIGPEICNFLTGQHSLTNHSNIYSPKTAVNTFMSKGGGTTMD